MTATSLSLEPERLSRLVGLAYEAPACDTPYGQREAWRAFTEETAEALGCQLAMVEYYDRDRPGDSFIATGGLHGFAEVFTVFRTRSGTDDYWTAMHDQPPGTISLGSELLRPDVLHKTRFYSSVALPWQLEHFLIGTIHTEANSCAFFTLARASREPPFQAGDKTLISRMLLTHLNRSMTLHREVTAMREANAILAAVIQGDRRESGVSLPALFRATYGLTRAEIRLCDRLLAGQSLAAAACVLDISRNTAKTQLTRVFDKTGVRSQRALLRLLTLGAELPIINPLSTGGSGTGG